jgi:hypothetical protein
VNLFFDHASDGPEPSLIPEVSISGLIKGF